MPPNGLSWLAARRPLGLQWMAVSVPPLSRLLGTAPLDGGDWLILLVAVLWPVVMLEGAKFRRARR